ncbi:unnamed protein product [Hyaloperonospora brassicae]|uniref:Bromo domain-containing protein n=1 Tax=Hyaloperonospora brassicae TaxID=162125 RepID=A0AAV0T7Q9_HYABA|nr:unnamed protein product [Hyaloperonospora brassicae]
MSSSSSSDFSDDDTEAPTLHAAPPSALHLDHMVELAQICSFCTTFRTPLRLPSFSRTELQEALLSASSGDIQHVELLAELHFKLAREHPTAKMEKMVQDWEKTLARKLQDNWRKAFTTNPMRGGVTYRDLTVLDRVKILDALCQWKLDTCGEIQKHIALLLKDNDDEAITSLRAGEIGTDDKGVSYWYFGDESWVYAEDKPRWQLEDRKPSYLVEFASAKRIRLSINFDPDGNASALPLRLPQKAISASDKIDRDEKAIRGMSSDDVNDEKKLVLESATMNGDVVPSGAVKSKTEPLTDGVVKSEKDAVLPVSVKAAGLVAEEDISVVKGESSIIAETGSYGGMGNGELTKASEAVDGKCDVSVPGLLLPVPLEDGGSLIKLRDGGKPTCAQSTIADDLALHIQSTQLLAKVPNCSATIPSDYGKKDTTVNEESSVFEGSGKTLLAKANGDRPGGLSRTSIVPILIGKKRTIVDDDSSDIDAEAASNAKAAYKASQSPILRKKRKASAEFAHSAACTDAVKTESGSMMLRGEQGNGTVILHAQGVIAAVTPDTKQVIAPAPAPDLVASIAMERKETEMPKADVKSSSRIAIGRMKSQSADDSDAKDGYSDDDFEARRPGLRSRRPHLTSDGDGKQNQDRAWRARRRRRPFDDDDMDLDIKENEPGSSDTGHWVDWSVLKRPQGDFCRLSAVCLALVNRLLKEEASEMFSRPVDPELDGCPNYLSVIDHPMDLGTIRSRAKAKFYRNWGLFKKDIALVWQNCRTYNAADTMVVQFAALLEKLSRSMCIAAEKKGVDRLSGKGNEGGDGGEDDSETNTLSDSSKIESRGSVNKAWTDSSASESRDSSQDDASTDDSDAQGHKRRLTRTLIKKSKTRARSTRSHGVTRQTRRSTRSRSTKKRSAPASSSEESFSDKDTVFSPVRKSRRQLRRSSSKSNCIVDAPTENNDFSDDDGATCQPVPPQKQTPTSSSLPPLPQTVQKRPKPRLVISDTSNSDDSSSSSDDSSSTSSSSDSDDSDSDARSLNNRPQPPPPSAVDASAPPPPSTPPPAAVPHDKNLPKRSSPIHAPKLKASEAKKMKTTPIAEAGYMHSPPLLNSYLSPSSSSSSDFSSGGSDSSDGDSDSD